MAVAALKQKPALKTFQATVHVTRTEQWCVEAETAEEARELLAHRLPAMYESREFIEDGGLISYGPNVPDLSRRAAAFVVKILNGAKPAELPIEQPTKFELVINLKIAKALGLEIPDKLLATADEVIE
jgi:ABC-type uncharacterized transport system substrate-binding protein